MRVSFERRGGWANEEEKQYIKSCCLLYDNGIYSYNLRGLKGLKGLGLQMGGCLFYTKKTKGR